MLIQCACQRPAQQVEPIPDIAPFALRYHESPADYLNDPAECNDATDKSLLPPNEDIGTPTEEQPLRAGVCYTSTTLIHLRSTDVNDPAPKGWSGPIAPVTLANGVTYVTYWLLTPQ